jgi:amidophosphoribosyltransferase
MIQQRGSTMKRHHFFYFFCLISFQFSFITAQEIKHECGLALVRLLRPLEFYQEKYGDMMWGLNKTCLLLEKQRNRGQDGAGIAVVKFEMPFGKHYLKRLRFAQDYALEHLLAFISQKIKEFPARTIIDSFALKEQFDYAGEVYLGHVRYGTYAGRGIEFCQPCVYKSSIPAKSLAIAGNFNMTNSDELKNEITQWDVAPTSVSDTQLILHQLSYLLDQKYEKKSHNNESCTIASIIAQAAHNWDGGYVFAGMLGNGDAFVCRDPSAIRPGFYFLNDEVFAVASERAALASVFNISYEDIKEIPAAHVISLKKDGTISITPFMNPFIARQCVFERIYFSRGHDPAICQERKNLGKQLAVRIFEELNQDITHTLFSFIPNTAEISFLGLTEELSQLSFFHHRQLLFTKFHDQISAQEIDQLMNKKIRAAKVIYKDQMLRTFISHESTRSDLASNVYDISKGIVNDDDTLVVIDDSIVRGTTLKNSIMKQLIQLQPAHIIVLSAAPMILYPDCYGIDMSQIGHLIAFKAAVELTHERGNAKLFDEIYEECIALQKEKHIQHNPLKKIYEQFSQTELEQKIAHLVTPNVKNWNGSIRVLFQTIEGLHAAIPQFTGDWYFTGNYPTPGGYRVLINSYINWYNGIEKRSY